MNFRISYSILFLFFAVKLFCQDVIVKKDSSKTEVKLLEVRPTEIKYKLFNYQEGPAVIINKSDVAYVIYSNGIKEILNVSEKPKTEPVDSFYFSKQIVWQGDTAKLTKYVEPKVGDYIKFNIQAGVVVYNSFSNVPRKNSLEMTSSDEYTNVSTKQNVSFNLGFNLMLGKNPYVKHVIGLNYLKAKSEFYYVHGNIGYSSYARYRSDIDFVNIVTGLRFTIFKKLHIDPLLALNVIAKSKTTRSGTETSFDYQTPPYTRYTKSFENEPTNNLVGSTISLAPKISYELPFKKNKLEMYVSYNFALRYRLPWYQFGFLIFPFKKLR